MFDNNSRYFSIPTTTIGLPDPDGGTREVRYIKRRIIPAGESMTTLVEHIFIEGERLDLITARYLGDPTQFWRVCDANNVMRPEEMEETNRTIKIAMPNV